MEENEIYCRRYVIAAHMWAVTATAAHPATESYVRN